MPPKKLILNPPKNPSQQPTRRIRFTNINHAIAQAGITVDEEARRRQDEYVRAASGGQAFKSTETPARMVQPGPASRESPNVGPASVVKVGAGAKRSASIASLGDIDDDGNLPQDNSKTDAPPDTDQLAPTSEKQQEMASSASMQPPAAIPQLPHAIQIPRPPTATPAYLPTTAFDRVMREPGKGTVSPHLTPHSKANPVTGLADALYALIQAETDPFIEHPHPWKMTIFPSAVQTQDGMAFHLGPSHVWLQVTIYLSEECLSRDQYRVIVGHGSTTLHAAESTIPGVYAYQFRLFPGVNPISINFLATINKRGEPIPDWPQQRHDFEKFVLTVNYLAHEPY